ncbi:Y-family DNA polymerase [Arenimonas sp.]|uniref:Y-family DNA polymerase n=1 Tax=Arenimonas sp. TaxID=1872635 RepID=UPI0039E4D0BC
MLWACVLLPQLALDTVLRRHPAPGKPLALVHGPLQRRTLLAANGAARARGLQPGQSFATAQALLPDLTAIEYDEESVAQARRLLAAWAYRYSSQVSVAFGDAIVLEIQGSLGLFGPWPLFEARLRDDLAALGFHHRIAMAPVASAAHVLAGHRDGLAIENTAPMLSALAQVPIAQARLPAAAAGAFEHLGLRRLGQVFALPRASLGKRHGPGLLAQLDRLRGDAPEILPLHRPPDVFDARIELSFETESTEALQFPLRRLTSDLAAYLAGRDGGVQRFVLRLEHEDHGHSDVPVGLLAPERDAALLFELARGRLAQASVPAPVRGLRLLARELPPFVPAGADLFDLRAQQGMPWEQLRERLRARLGNEAVHGLSAVAEHRPEYAWRRDAGETSPMPVQEPLPRPAWLLERPVPLRDARLQLLAGPERIETGWWDGDDAQRDYYVAETSQGQRAWVFCAPGERGAWMLHGWFA